MDYCEVCDSLLIAKKINEDKVVPYCDECGTHYERGKIQDIVYDIKNDDPDHGKILVFDKADMSTNRAKRDIYCEECKSTQLVEYWEIQTRSADESATRFFRCTNCDKNWREYD